MNRSILLLVLQLTNFILPPAGAINTRLDYLVPRMRFIKIPCAQDVIMIALIGLIGFNTLVKSPEGLTGVAWLTANSLLAWVSFGRIEAVKRPEAVKQLFVLMLSVILFINIMTVMLSIDMTQVYFNKAYQRAHLSEYQGQLRAFFPFVEPRQLASFSLFFIYIAVVTGLKRWKNAALFLLSAGIIYLTMSKSAIFAALALLGFLSVVLYRGRVLLPLVLASAFIGISIQMFGESSRYTLPNFSDIVGFFENPAENKIAGYGWDTYITGIYIAAKIVSENWILGIGKGGVEAIAQGMDLRRMGAQGIFGIFIEMGIVGILLHYYLFLNLYKRAKHNINSLYLYSYMVLLFVQFNISGLYSLTNPMWIAQSSVFCALFWNRR